jgi:hypothetical protein
LFETDFQIELAFYNMQIADSKDNDDEEKDKKVVVSPCKHAKCHIKNEFVDNTKDLDDVSSFGLGGNDGKEFGDVSKRWIMHLITCFVTCLNFEICYAIHFITRFFTFLLMSRLLGK